MVEQSEFPVYEGQHEAIISEEDWYLAQEKRKINSFKREKVNNPDHAHILSGILKCPCCGKSMYGNIAKAHSKDKKTRYYYYCKNTVTPTGHWLGGRMEGTKEGTKGLITTDAIRSKVYILRGQQVMLDQDLAEIYGYQVKNLNQQVKRNLTRFPEDFMFQLTKEEVELVKSQFVTSRNINYFEAIIHPVIDRLLSLPDKKI